MVNQKDTYDSIGQITIEGNAKENIRELLGETVNIKQIRYLNNNYYFVAKSANRPDEDFLKDLIAVYKTITISANGNVFPGCIMEYKRVDNEFMFNIKECNKNFFEKVIDYCWKHPLSKKSVLNVRNTIKKINFCKDNGIKIEPFDDYLYEKYKIMDKLLDSLEQISKDMHKMLPNLFFDGIEVISIATLLLELFDRNAPLSFIKEFLYTATDLEKETIENISVDMCRGLILFLSEKDRKLGLEKSNVK